MDSNITEQLLALARQDARFRRGLSRTGTSRQLLRFLRKEGRRRLLLDLANLRPVFRTASGGDPAYRKFRGYWGRLYPTQTEELVGLRDGLRKVWNPKTPTNEKQAVLDSWMAWCPPGFQGIGYSTWLAVWGKDEPSPDRHNLRAALALGVLDQWRRFAVCGNGDCWHPYFLKQRKTQRYCSEECAEPSQRKMKRESWKKHGKKWRKKSRSKKGQRRSRKSITWRGRSRRKKR
ncbi:hypothetical protein LCGC14_1172020 [marine sediment metagenome]|uniref:Uncharacterized protein n=1 Tax=marine sediment metagenome TaxID=412755 RepID=A0A0F9MCI1_9ZZZZ